MLFLFDYKVLEGDEISEWTLVSPRSKPVADDKILAYNACSTVHVEFSKWNWQLRFLHQWKQRSFVAIVSFRERYLWDIIQTFWYQDPSYKKWYIYIHLFVVVSSTDTLKFLRPLQFNFIMRILLTVLYTSLCQPWLGAHKENLFNNQELL